MSNAERFMAAVRGIAPRHVMQALCVLCPGTDYRNCSKKLVAQNYESAFVRRWTDSTSQKLRRIDLDRLARMAKARADGERDWRARE